jgi:hypothetical protein
MLKFIFRNCADQQETPGLVSTNGRGGRECQPIGEDDYGSIFLYSSFMKLKSETQKGEEIVCKCTFRESIKKQMAKTLIYIFCYFLRLWVIHVHDCLSYGIRRKKTP